MIKIIQGVKTIFPDDLTIEDIEQIVAEELNIWHDTGRKLGRVEIEIQGNELNIKSTERSPITRLRRITGYLSNVDNFNDAKRAEERDRVDHVRGERA